MTTASPPGSAASPPGSWQLREHAVAEPPAELAYCRHLMTVEAGPADEMDPDCTGFAFVSRCICGHNIPWGPYRRVMAAIRDHLVSVGLLGQDAPEARKDTP